MKQTLLKYNLSQPDLCMCDKKYDNNRRRGMLSYVGHVCEFSCYLTKFNQFLGVIYSFTHSKVAV